MDNAIEQQLRSNDGVMSKSDIIGRGADHIERTAMHYVFRPAGRVYCPTANAVWRDNAHHPPS